MCSSDLDYEGPAVDLDEQKRLVRDLGANDAMILRNHGLLTTGRTVYQGRCALCHGKEGGADGKMAAIIKDPPPVNLKLSRAPDEYLRLIIAKGGGAMGRSPRMPPWGEDLNKAEIDSVILFLKTLRD